MRPDCHRGRPLSSAGGKARAGAARARGRRARRPGMRARGGGVRAAMRRDPHKGAEAGWPFPEMSSRFGSLFAPELFRKPLRAVRDHALTPSSDYENQCASGARDGCRPVLGHRPGGRARHATAARVPEIPAIPAPPAICDSAVTKGLGESGKPGRYLPQPDAGSSPNQVTGPQDLAFGSDIPSIT